jgi:sec-independent protein translocase protein TatA
MNFSNIGFTEILILLLVFVLFFGARRIPEIGASIGKGIREFKNSLTAKGDEDQPAIPPPAPGASVGSRGTDGEPKRLTQ